MPVFQPYDFSNQDLFKLYESIAGVSLDTTVLEGLMTEITNESVFKTDGGDSVFKDGAGDPYLSNMLTRLVQIYFLCSNIDNDLVQLNQQAATANRFRKNSNLVFQDFTNTSMALLLADIETYRAANSTKTQVDMCVVVNGANYEALITYSTIANP